MLKTLTPIFEIRKKLRTKNNKSITCFNFHQVAKDFDRRFHMQGTFTKLSEFEKIVKWVKKEYTLVDINSALKMQKNKTINDKYACITFDDGDKTIENVIPYLDSEEAYASFYINTLYLDANSTDSFRIINFIINNNILVKENINLNQLSHDIRHTLDRSKYNLYKKIVYKTLYKYVDKEINFHTTYDYLHSIKSQYIHFGLHGHEHDRFILLNKKEIKDNLMINRDKLKGLSNYTNTFAIPFGRINDWNHNTIEVCNEMGLDILFANGGYNIGDEVGFKRVPADNRNIILESRFGYFQ
jgi:peptidoglycan/xylan/chitin deacetylase (PgdA/CDA1 family)